MTDVSTRVWLGGFVVVVIAAALLGGAFGAPGAVVGTTLGALWGTARRLRSRPSG
ncbi:MAG: hypothetical protein QOK43_3011 [Acidimicrobiaceae bacterium]|nr:hypothetical protein [Acidimicrobiaceae bacterium]